MGIKKTIAVVGATGAQGGGLVRAILDDPEGGFAVRAITRDANSDKSRALANMGAEVIVADVDDHKSMLRAFDGVYGAYCVTFFWDHLKPGRELAEAESMAEAAKAGGLQHVIWSTLEDTRKWVPLSDNRMPTLMDVYKVPHFDAKGASDHFFTDNGVPTTFLYASFYWNNFIHFGMGPQLLPDGRLGITMPLGDAKLAGIATEDIGRCAYGVFKNGNEWIGKTVGVAGGQLTGAEMAATFTKHLGHEVVYNEVPPEVYRSFDFPGADEVANMFQFYHDFASDVNAVRSVEVSRKLNPKLKSFDEWLGLNADRIPIG
jgi:uncharacterized protein YbjT (DUF2867 family)